VDAGPVIGAIDIRDEFHGVATRGFQALHAAQTRVIILLPIIFEVYKRIAYDVNPDSAHRALDLMLDGFELVFITNSDMVALRRLVDSMPWWEGSLEDATLALIGLRRDVPVWTFNYRDLRVFPKLQFWTPS